MTQATTTRPKKKREITRGVRFDRETAERISKFALSAGCSFSTAVLALAVEGLKKKQAAA